MNKRILGCYLLVTILLVTGLQIYLTLFVKNYYISRLKKELFTQAELMRDLMPSSRTNLDAFCKEYRMKTGARITIIDGRGNVLGDSDEASSRMENHLDRPEIREAMFSGRGSSIRFSNTLKKEFIYVAISLDSPDQSKTFLRLSLPLDRVREEIDRIRIPVIVSTILILLIISSIWFYQSRRLRREVREIIEFSDRVASGDFDQRLYIEGDSELSRLASHIAHMAKELKAKLTEVNREKQTIELILKNMTEGLLIIDDRGSVLLINDALMRVLGIKFTERVMTAVEILRDAELLNMIDESIKRHETISGEIPFRDRHLMVIASPVELSDQRKATIVTFHDITNLKRLEQIRKDFVANVAHEIKTPITAIKGFAETLLDGAIEDRENARKFLDIIKRHSERLNSLVNDLLTLSSIEQGEIRLEIAEIDLSELIDSLLALMEGKARMKGLYLKKTLPEDMPPVRADRDRLFQILLNLIDNGIKFTDSGGVVAGAEKREDKIIIFVEDTGCGIEKKHLSRLGERFYRVDRARSRELGGTGLGLAIVKHLVKAHGWDMEIESTPGRGTKVKIITG